jgi:hypothetical protein
MNSFDAAAMDIPISIQFLCQKKCCMFSNERGVKKILGQVFFLIEISNRKKAFPFR